jgi:hypothetical protein
MGVLDRLELKAIAFAVLVFLIALPGTAQTVRPVIVQYSGPARGKVELVNNGLQPLTVVLEPMSFTITEDGEGVYGPLTPDIHLKLSTMSLRIPPQQSRYVFYQASADKIPAWFVIRNVFSGPIQKTGLNTRLDIPHTVYLVQKEVLGKPDVLVESASFLTGSHQVEILLTNPSSKLGRVLDWQVSSKGAKTTNNGFPLLPGARRRLAMHWNSAEAPDTVSFRFEHFTLKEGLLAKP